MDDELTPYIEFKDLPDTSQPVDAEALNDFQKLVKADVRNRLWMPTGGTTGQALVKSSDTDYDVNWATIYNKQMIVDLVHPVGSYYETSVASFDPNTYWGGTWVEDTEGLTTVAYKQDDSDFGTLGATVGSKTHKMVQSENYWNVQGQNPSSPQGGMGGYLVTHDNNQTAIPIVQPSKIVKRWHRIA